MSTKPTPALLQAEFLEALAAHLRAHPHLAEVRGYLHGYDLGLDTNAQSGGLIAWARSFGVDRLRSMPIGLDGWSCVEFEAVMGRTQVRVWARIDGLTQAGELSVAELETFGNTAGGGVR